MSEKIKVVIVKFFTENIVLKFSSLFLSIFLWFIVMNINNPTETRNFTVELTLLNESTLEENNIVLLNKEELEGQKIQIKVKGTRQALSELNKTENKEQIVASLNLNQFKYLTSLESSDYFSANVDISLPNLSYSYEISNINPISVSLNLDKQSTISKKINVKKIGSLSDDYISKDVELSSEYIQITGASSILESIESVFIELNIDRATSSIEDELYPVAYDSSGNVVDGVTFNPSKITAVAPIYKKLDIEVLEPRLIGEVAEGYFVSNVSYFPTSLSIYVSESLENINKTITPVVDISNLDTSSEFTFSINEFFENDEDIYYEVKNQIVISVELEEIKSLDLKLNTEEITLINFDENTKILEEEVSFSLIGKEEDLDSISISDIEISANLDNLGEDKKIKLSFELPEGIYLKEDVYISVNSESLE